MPLRSALIESRFLKSILKNIDKNTLKTSEVFLKNKSTREVFTQTTLVSSGEDVEKSYSSIKRNVFLNEQDKSQEFPGSSPLVSGGEDALVKILTLVESLEFKVKKKKQRRENLEKREMLLCDPKITLQTSVKDSLEFSRQEKPNLVRDSDEVDSLSSSSPRPSMSFTPPKTTLVLSEEDVIYRNLSN